MKFRRTEIGLPAGDVWLDGILVQGRHSPGLIVITERSSRRLDDTRGAVIASVLQEVGFATLQVGLLAFGEKRTAPSIWNQVPTLCTRIAAIATWIQHQPALKPLPLGIIASDVAAAAMVRVAARADAPFRALACRDGRPDLAGIEPLRSLATPLLMVAGERDEETLIPNQRALEQLDCPKELAVIAGASGGFKEPGTLDEALQRIIAWFVRWLAMSHR